MKKVIVTSQKLKDIPEKFEPVWYANKLLIQSEFEDGKLAFVQYSKGKLRITVPSHIQKKLKKYGDHI